MTIQQLKEAVHYCIACVVVAGFAFALLVGIGKIPAQADSKPRPRFEAIYIEQVDVDQNGPDRFYVFHDKETGSEIICIRESNSAYSRATSCFLSGRAWGR